MSSLISADEIEKIAQYVYTFVIPPFVILGLFGNITIFIVLRRYPKKTPTILLLFALAGFDFIYLLSTTFVLVVTIVRYINPTIIMKLDMEFLSPVFMFLWSVPSHCSNWTIMMISVDRVLAVLLPFKVRDIWTKRASIIAIIICALLPCIISVPRIFTRKMVETYDNDTQNIDRKYEYATIDGVDIHKILTLNRVFTCLAFPVCVVFSANICIAYGLFRNSKNPSLQLIKRSSVRQENRVTKTLVIISVMFLVCVFPYCIFTTYNEITRDETALYTNGLVELMFYIGYLLVIINSSVNFIVYILSSRQFRAIYNDLFCLNCVKQRSSSFRNQRQSLTRF